MSIHFGSQRDRDELAELGSSGGHASSGETHMPDDEWHGHSANPLVQRFLSMTAHEHDLQLGRLQQSTDPFDEPELAAAQEAMTIRRQHNQPTEPIDPAWRPMLDKMNRIDENDK